MLRQKRDHSRLGQHGEAFGSNGGQQRRLVTEREQCSFARGSGFAQRGKHGEGCLREFAFRRHLGTEISERFNCAQQPPEIVFLHCHAGW